MLVITRKVDELVVINENITIMVVDIIGDRVRLGIKAPKGIPIHRDDAINREPKPKKGTCS